MKNNNILHHHFASYFKDSEIRPFAYVLSKRMENGHICIPINSSINQNLSEGGFETNLKFPTSSLVATNQDELKPFVFYKDNFYLQRYFKYETSILESLHSLAKNQTAYQKRKEALTSQSDFIRNQISPKTDLSNYTTDEKPDWQAVAAIQGVLNNLTIITGGPGTGKTTTVAKILALLKRVEGEKLSIALAAPTGKAAVRMKESLLSSVKNSNGLDIENIVTAIQPKTIHRLLGTNYNSPFFKHNAENSLPYDVVIVDESSMISVAMFAKLLDAIGKDTRLIILGDSDQLASVDAGSIFGDICKSQEGTENKFTSNHLTFLNSLIQTERAAKDILEVETNFLNQHLIRLKKTYRFNQNSKMGKFTQAVIQGKSEKFEEIINSEDDNCLFVDTEYQNGFFETFIKKFKGYIEEEDIEKALIKLNDCRVLCAVKQSEQGVYRANELIQNYLKIEYSNRKHLFNPSGELYHNQIIMVTKNQADLNLFNGDVGIVRVIDNIMKVYFPNVISDSGENITKKYYEVAPGFIEQWETVFAMTIHKSQGSEFDAVFVMLPKNSNNRLLTRELLYTGLTRAKNQADLQGSLEVIKTTTDQSIDRVSGIKERIQTTV